MCTLLEATAAPTVDDDDRITLVEAAISSVVSGHYQQFMIESRDTSRLSALFNALNVCRFLDDKEGARFLDNSSEYSGKNPRQSTPDMDESSLDKGESNLDIGESSLGKDESSQDSGRSKLQSSDPNQISDEDGQSSIALLRNSLANAISDLAAKPEFFEQYSSRKSIQTTLDIFSKGLTVTPSGLSQQCACLVMGNMAQSDESCVALVSFPMHPVIIDIIRESDDASAVHAALGAMRNLAIPKVNKPTLVKDHAFGALSRVWSSTNFPPDMHRLAATVARQLVNLQIDNIRDFLTVHDADGREWIGLNAPFSIMLSAFDKSKDAAACIGIGRVVAALLRTIYAQGRFDSDKNDLMQRLWTQHGVANTLEFLVTQPHSPVIRSEGWFALALAARSTSGCREIMPTLLKSEVRSKITETLKSGENEGGSDIDGETQDIYGEGLHTREAGQERDSKGQQREQQRQQITNEEQAEESGTKDGFANVGANHRRASTETSSNEDQGLSNRREDQQNVQILIHELLKHKVSNMFTLCPSSFYTLGRYPLLG